MDFYTNTARVSETQYNPLAITCDQACPDSPCWQYNLSYALGQPHHAWTDYTTASTLVQRRTRSYLVLLLCPGFALSSDVSALSQVSDGYLPSFYSHHRLHPAEHHWPLDPPCQLGVVRYEKHA
jgi:hypothetical protein